MSALWPFRASRLATFALTCRVSSGDRPLISVQAHHLEEDAFKDTGRGEKKNGKKKNRLFFVCGVSSVGIAAALRRTALTFPLTHADSQHHVPGKLFSLSAFCFKGGAMGTDIGMKGRDEPLTVEGKSMGSAIPRQEETRLSRSEQTRPDRKSHRRMCDSPFRQIRLWNFKC